MDDFVFPLLLGLDVQSLTMSLVNIASPVGDEGGLADSIEQALSTLVHLQVARTGDTVIASTDVGHQERVVIAGCLGVASSTDPLAFVEMGRLFGPGASAAKGALAVMLKAAALGTYSRDVTFVFYAGDDVEIDGSADLVLSASPTRSAVLGDALDHPAVRRLVELTDVPPVSGEVGGPFASCGIPVVAFGPGDPSLAGASAEFVPTAELGQCEYVLRQWLTT